MLKIEVSCSSCHWFHASKALHCHDCGDNQEFRNYRPETGRSILNENEGIGEIKGVTVISAGPASPMGEMIKETGKEYYR